MLSASDFGIGAVLSQCQEDLKEYVVAMQVDFSLSLNATTVQVALWVI